MEILSLIRINKTIYDKMKKKTLSYGEYEAVTNGLLRIVRNEGITLPENATNGDVIKTMFPNLIFTDSMVDGYINTIEKHLIGKDTHTMYFDLNWWKAPYRGINDKRGEI